MTHTSVWSTYWNRHAQPIIHGLGAIALVCLLSMLAMQAWQDGSRLLTPPPPVATATKAPTGSANSSLSSQALVNINMMGHSNQAIATTNNKSLPTTRLQLQLRGTFTHSDPKQASALIAERNKSAKRYHNKEALPGGATLAEVRSDSVVLSRNGRLENLFFPAPSSPSGKSGQQTSHQVNTPPRRPPVSAPMGDVGGRTESIRQRLERLRNKNKK